MGYCFKLHKIPDNEKFCAYCGARVIPLSKLWQVGFFLWMFIALISQGIMSLSALLLGNGNGLTSAHNQPTQQSNLVISTRDMVLIPGGSFQMGSETGASDEKPVHTVTLDAFYIDIYEVSNARYAECEDAEICPLPAGAVSGSYRWNSDYPVLGVSWYDADTYCQWRGGRLPTEAEWEKAARGKLSGKVYPWGDDDPLCRLDSLTGLNFSGCSSHDPVAVGSFYPNSYGLYDMAGNVLEWVGDWYASDYYQDSPAQNPMGPARGEDRVMRGGSYVSNAGNVRVAKRFHVAPTKYYSDGGFRCVVPAPGQ